MFTESEKIPECGAALPGWEDSGKLKIQRRNLGAIILSVEKVDYPYFYTLHSLFSQIILKQYFTIKIKADSPLTRLSALNSSRHIQFHYYLILSELYNFLSYHNLYGFRHLRTEYSCCLHIQAS